LPRTDVIIVNWNGCDATLRCLDSAARLPGPARIVVVDNGSADGSVPAIRDAFPGVTLLEAGANLGYAGGLNLGIRHCRATGEAPLLVLNNDTVLEPHLLDELHDAAARRPRAAILAPLILQDGGDERIWYGGGKWDARSLRFHHVARGCEPGAAGAEGPTDYACGCAMYLRPALLPGSGLFDERFFLTYEDTDLCYRARRHGAHTCFVPRARLYHRPSSSFGGEGTPMAAYFLARNRLLWGQKHLGHDAFARMLFRSVVRVLSPGALREWRDGAVRARRTGVLHFLARRFHDCPAWLRQRSPK